MRYISWAAMILVAAAVVGALFLVGSPAHERLVRLDERRLSHLQDIQYQVSNYFSVKDRLPASLEDLSGFEGFMLPADPESGASYEYSKTGNMAFRLCADFSLQSETPEYGRYPSGASWRHASGRACFDISLEKPASADGKTYPSVTVSPAI